MPSLKSTTYKPKPTQPLGRVAMMRNRIGAALRSTFSTSVRCLLISGSLVRVQQAEPTTWLCGRSLRRFAYLLAACLTTACTEIPREEYGYQLIHLVDSAQTVQIARSKSDCFWESAPGTEQLIGKHPSTSGALMWGIGAAAAHLGVSMWLEDHAPRWVYTSWQSVTIGRSAYYVGNNFRQGIGVTGSDC